MLQENIIINYDRIKLGQESYSIINNSESFDKLKLPINSTIGYSQAVSQFRITRQEHSIHAAKQSHLIRNADLTGYEKKCLEVALLLHDLGHTLGSHSMDKLYYSMADSPQLSKFGYSKQDYHEYHTVELLQTNEFKDLFKHNPTLLSDVMAILSHDDSRPFEHKCSGSPSPSLTPKQVKLLYDIKDWLDRVSYLELEYLVSGSTNEIITTAMNQLNRFKNTIEVHDKQLIFRDNSAVENIISLREAIYQETVYHPLAHAYDEYIKRNVNNSYQTYKDLKEAAFFYPEKLFTKELYDVFTQNTNRCISQELTPLVTLDHYLLTDVGLRVFSEYTNNKQQSLNQAILKRPFSASFGELMLNNNLDLNIGSELYTINAKRTLKEYNYTTLVNNKPSDVTRVVNENPSSTIIIAVRNAESDDQVHLLKNKIEEEFVRRQWVRPDLNFNIVYDKDIFKSRAGSILGVRHTH